MIIYNIAAKSIIERNNGNEGKSWPSYIYPSVDVAKPRHYMLFTLAKFIVKSLAF